MNWGELTGVFVASITVVIGLFQFAVGMVSRLDKQNNRFAAAQEEHNASMLSHEREILRLQNVAEECAEKVAAQIEEMKNVTELERRTRVAALKWRRRALTAEAEKDKKEG